MRSFNEIAERVRTAERELAAARAELRAYLDGTESQAAPQMPPEPASQTKPIGERIITALAQGGRLRVADIARRCDTEPDRAFRQALNRLHSKGRVRIIERGVYALR